MNVRIVCQNDGDHVLARMARALSLHTGWSIGRKPDRRADWNYFLPYLNFTPVPTRTVAYFSHLEWEGRKARQWREVDEDIDLRIITARRYASDVALPVAVVRPPVERDKFTPLWAGERDKPVVGVSGMVYATGRKGEGLVKRLIESEVGERIQLVASGRGWTGIETTYYPWAEMQTFYQSLDVLLCTSAVEGVPMPVLEALSCGVPVVVPRDVGLLDDLPDLPGIQRYRAGDYDDMLIALRRLVDVPLPGREGWERRAEQLRAVTEPYTARHWAEDHVSAFEGQSEDVPAGRRYALPVDGVRAYPDTWAGKAGMYTVAYGEPARRCAARLLWSWRKHMSGIPVVLATDAPEEFEAMGAGEWLTLISPERPDIGARLPKLRVYELTPPEWEYVLYLDADCELMQPVEYFFDALAAGWEFIICKNPGKFHSAKEMARANNQEEVAETWRVMGGEDRMQWNGGVFAFRRMEAVAAMFERWIEGWQWQCNQDQPALHRAIYTAPLRMLVLGNEWNCSTRYPDGKAREIVRHHQMEARQMQGKKLPPGVRGDSRAAWKMVGVTPPAGAK